MKALHNLALYYNLVIPLRVLIVHELIGQRGAACPAWYELMYESIL